MYVACALTLSSSITIFICFGATLAEAEETDSYEATGPRKNGRAGGTLKTIEVDHIRSSFGRKMFSCELFHSNAVFCLTSVLGLTAAVTSSDAAAGPRPKTQLPGGMPLGSSSGHTARRWKREAKATGFHRVCSSHSSGKTLFSSRPPILDVPRTSLSRHRRCSSAVASIEAGCARYHAARRARYRTGAGEHKGASSPSPYLSLQRDTKKRTGGYACVQSPTAPFRTRPFCRRSRCRPKVTVPDTP